MQKTVREIIEMITNGELHYNQSTQRRFVYADMSVQLPGGVTTKSGSLLNAILERNIQLPAIYFWQNTDTGMLNIHDGKQRILSIYYFINPTTAMNISTIIDGREVVYEGLTEEMKNKLLNYTFDIVYREGTSLEEEESFDLINSNAVPLTKYECLSGMFYGTFLSEFESYVDTMASALDAVKKVGRGEQAYRFLLTCFNINDSKQSGSDASNLRLKDALRPIRRNSFNAPDYSFDRILILFNELSRVVRGLKEERALAVASYIVRSGFDSNRILDYYRECMRLMNDITSWDLATHKTFINKFVQDNLRLDPQRNFNKDIKDQLYARSPRCSHVDTESGQRCTETSYSKLEIDHITAWANGGRTTLDNAQLLCKHHNTSKGNRE